MKKLGNEEMQEISQQLINPKFKGALLMTQDDTEAFTNTSFFKQIFCQLPEKLQSGHLVMSFPPNHFMYETFNEKIEQLTNSGIIQK